MSRDLVIEAGGLQKRYSMGSDVRAALDGADLRVERGEFVAVLGASGSGKSTLLGIVGGLDRSYQGQLKLFGQDPATMSDAELAALRGARIGFVFQAFHLLGHLSALENLLVPVLFLREGGDAASLKKYTERAEQLLAELGLEGRGKDMPSHMSGGERQRLAIGRALLLEPELLLCDEPTGNLDIRTGEQIVEIFERLHQEQGLTVVAVTHEERLAVAATRTERMRAGRLYADGIGADKSGGAS